MTKRFALKTLAVGAALALSLGAASLAQAQTKLK